MTTPYKPANLREMIALIDADLEANGDITDERIAELHTVIDAAPVKELIPTRPKEISPGGQRVIDLANKIRADIAKLHLSKATADEVFYARLLEEL